MFIIGEEINLNESQIAVVMPLYNAISVASQAFDFLLSSGCPPAIVHIYDDASTDCGTDAFRERVISCGANWRASSQNVGYTKNINQAFREIERDYILLLNSDCFLTASTLTRLLSHAESNLAIAAVGPLSNFAGSQTVQIMARKDWSFLQNSEIAYSIQFMEDRCRWKFGDRPISVPSVNGFCALWRRSALEEVDFFDTVNFPRGYGEEDDACFRLTEQGYLCIVVPSLVAIHLKTKSFTLSERATNKEKAALVLKQLYGDTYFEGVVNFFRDHPILQRIASEPVDV